MFALMSLPDCIPVIVNTASPDFAELAQVGYIPTQTGTKKRLQLLFEEMYEGLNEELEVEYMD